MQLDTRSITFNIIAINVLLFVVSWLYPTIGNYLELHYIFNRHDYVAELLGNAELAAIYPAVASVVLGYGIDAVGFQPVQLISHLFMHGGISHIFFNMYGVFMFGSILERVWGPQRFLLYYFITGFGAVALHMLVQALLVMQATGTVDPSLAQLNAHPDAMGTYFVNTVGASGAVFGLLAGFAMLFPNTELMMLFIPFPIKAKYFVGVYVLIELYLGVAMYGGDNVAHFAHLGGALFGFILVKIWNKNRHTLY